MYLFDELRKLDKSNRKSWPQLVLKFCKILRGWNLLLYAPNIYISIYLCIAYLIQIKAFLYDQYDRK
jgi:hypothetical protein